MRATTVKARLRTLSQAIAEHGIRSIDLLKINVEKSELDVLRGLEPQDWAKVKQMVIEVDLKENLQPITDLLASHGFDLLVEQDPLLAKTELCYVYAVRPGEGRKLLRGETAFPATPPPAEQPLAPASLRKHLNDRLPRHMVPQAFVLMERFPLMPNGKIDRQALPLPDAVQPPAGFVAPRTSTEKALAALWCELLERDEIGVDEDFFDAGGKSLVAMRLVARIRAELGVDIQLRNLFERPTIGGLSEIVDALSWQGEAQAAPGSGEREELTL
jgi:aryl carrier-like protein